MNFFPITRLVPTQLTGYMKLENGNNKHVQDVIETKKKYTMRWITVLYTLFCMIKILLYARSAGNNKGSGMVPCGTPPNFVNDKPNVIMFRGDNLAVGSNMFLFFYLFTWDTRLVQKTQKNLKAVPHMFTATRAQTYALMHACAVDRTRKALFTSRPSAESIRRSLVVGKLVLFRCFFTETCRQGLLLLSEC